MGLRSTSRESRQSVACWLHSASSTLRFVLDYAVPATTLNTASSSVLALFGDWTRLAPCLQNRRELTNCLTSSFLYLHCRLVYWNGRHWVLDRLWIFGAIQWYEPSFEKLQFYGRCIVLLRVNFSLLLVDENHKVFTSAWMTKQLVFQSVRVICFQEFFFVKMALHLWCRLRCHSG